MSNIDKMKEAPLSELLDDGINDRNLFKAVIFAGGPGSGKSVITKQVMAGMGAKIVNPDQLFMLAGVHSSITRDPYAMVSMARLYKVHKAIKDGDQKLQPVKWFSDNLQNYRDTRLKFLLKKGVSNWIDEMLPLVVDDTGRDPAKIKKQLDFLTSLGYDVAMVFVNTAREVALSRNQVRSRKLPDTFVAQNWKRVQANIGKFNMMFGSRFYVVDNNKVIPALQERDAPDDMEFLRWLTSIGRKAFATSLKNPIGKKVLDTLKLTGGKYYSDVFKEMEM